jgi:hypothetical protein
MPYYNSTELQQRYKILQSQLIFGEYLDIDIINRLINLFDDTSKNSDYKVSKYLSDERTYRNLNNSNMEIKGDVYGNRNKGYTLGLAITKNNNDYIHLTIHLSLNSLKPEDAGMLHIYKDIYEKYVSRKGRTLLYSLISIEIPSGKQNSLHFSIGYGYNTPVTVSSSHNYDSELKPEIDAFIAVLNKLFDEDNTEFYIGNKRNLNKIHNSTNIISENINVRNNHYTRKNKGSRMFQIALHNNSMHINMSKYKPKPKKNPSRSSRKVIKKRGNYV